MSYFNNKTQRSIDQMLYNHLPGSIKSYNNSYYLLKKVTTTNQDASTEILNVIYEDLIGKLNYWSDQYCENIKKDHYKITDCFNIKTDAYEYKKNETKLNELNGFSKNCFTASNLAANKDKKKEKDKDHHIGEYFPYTVKCNNCNAVGYSKDLNKPTNEGSTHRCSSSVSQLSIFQISPYGGVESIAQKEANDKNKKSFWLKCSILNCGGYLKIKESNQAKETKLECSKDPKHQNYKQLSKDSYMLYSVFSSSAFQVHRSEVINFDLSNLPVQISDYDFLSTLKVHQDKLNRQDLRDLNENYSWNDKEKKEIISKYPLLFNTVSNQSVQLDLNNPAINQICHDQIDKKIKQEKYTTRDSTNELLGVAKIGLVSDIEVINYSYGYSRISDRPLMTSAGVVKFNFFYTTQDEKSSEYPIDKATNVTNNKKQIFYTKEHNKGIYFKISDEKIKNLVKGINKTQNYLDQEKIYTSDYYLEIFTYLHGIAHFFIKTISQHFSGINTASLSEMIFPEHYAFVIYKTGTGKDLDYLDSFFDEYIAGSNKDFFDYINNKNNLICPAFELCGENGACIECLFTSKHTCKYHNEMLNLKKLLL